MDQLLVVVGQQTVQLGHGLAGHDDADIFYSGDGALDDGQTVAVQRNDGQPVRLDLEQLAGVGGLFGVLAHGI